VVELSWPTAQAIAVTTRVLAGLAVRTTVKVDLGVDTSAPEDVLGGEAVVRSAADADVLELAAAAERAVACGGRARAALSRRSGRHRC
jgi:hypothetical protein